MAVDDIIIASKVGVDENGNDKVEGWHEEG
jgi:hypothetical protein